LDVEVSLARDDDEWYQRQYDEEIHREESSETLSLPQLKQLFRDLIGEYLVGGNLHDLKDSFEELGAFDFSDEFIKIALKMGIDSTKNRERELVSLLIADCSGVFFDREAIESGFERCLESLDQIAIDAPNAHKYLRIFIARAIVDEALTRAWLDSPRVKRLAGPLVVLVKSLLDAPHGYERIDKMWNAFSVVELKGIVDGAVDEYMISGDMEEVKRSWTELETPGYGHELVKRGIRASFDFADGRDKIVTLLRYLMAEGNLPEEQVRRGIERVRESMEDIKLDVPAAEGKLHEIETSLIPHA